MVNHVLKHDFPQSLRVWVADKITFYPQWTWPKWVVPLSVVKVFSHKFEHPKSTPYYFSLLQILSVTPIYGGFLNWGHQISSMLCLFFHNMGKTIKNNPNHHRRYKTFPNRWFIIVLTCFNHIIINHPFILGYISMTMDTSFGASLKSTWNWSESAFTPVMRPMAWDLWWEKPSKSHGLLWGINNFHGLSIINFHTFSF